MKKSLRGLLFLMMMLFLPTTAAAEELKLPAIPVKIKEIANGKRYQVIYNLLINQSNREKYFEDFKSITHSRPGKPDKSLRGTVYDNARLIQIRSNQIELQTEDALVIQFTGYPKLKLTIKDQVKVQNEIYWNFDWEIVDEEGAPIAEPLSFAKERATAQIKSLTNLSSEDQEKWIARLNEKEEYQDVYAVYEKAFIRNGASQEMLQLFDLLAENEQLLTEDEVAKFERDIETYPTPQKAEKIKKTIVDTANATIPELECTITAPQTDVTLPTEVTITSDGIGTCELTWSVEGKTCQGEAKENTAYTAQCRIKLDDGKRLIPGKSKITVNEKETKVEPGGKDGEYFVTYPFPKTETLQKEYKVTWDKNGGTGTMNPTTVTDEKLKLPECEFTPPKGKVFDAWMIDEKRHSVGEEVSITGDLTIYAQWQDKPTVPDTDTPTDSDTDPRIPEYRAPQAPTVRMRASDGSGTYVEGPAEALRNAHELVVVRRSPSRWDLSLRDFSGREVYSDRLMLVTVPVESFGTENLRLLVDGVYTSFSVSEDGKSVTFPAYFTKDGKRPVEDLLFASDDIEVHGNRSVLPEEGCRFVIEKKSAAKFEVNLVNARGETVHTTGPVWISFPAPDGNATHWRVKIDGRETTFEVENGRVRVAEMI